MSSSSPSGPSLREFTSVLGRHKRKMLLVFCATMILVVGAVCMIPPQYTSESKLLLRIGRENVALDPTATIGERINLSSSRETETNTVLEILQSRTIVRRVVDRVGVDDILGTHETPTLAASMADGVTRAKDAIKGVFSQASGSSEGKASDPAAELHDEAMDKLLGCVTISAPRETMVVSVRCSARSPELAQRVVQAWTDCFLEEHIRLNGTEGSHDFFVRQGAILDEQLQKTEEALRDQKNESQIASIEGQRVLIETLQGEVELETIRNESALAVSQARRQAHIASIASLPQRILTGQTDGIANEASDGMRQQLYDLEIRERELLEKYESKHPLVQAIQRQVAAMRIVLQGQDNSRIERTFEVHPGRQALELELLQEESMLASLKAKREALAQQHREIVRKMKALNAYEPRIEALQRRAESLAVNHQLYVEKSEQSRINDAMASERITSVNVIQVASLEAKPAGKSKSSLILVGILVAMIGTLGVAMLAERLDPSMKSIADVEQALSLPVLVSIPSSSQECVDAS